MVCKRLNHGFGAAELVRLFSLPRHIDGQDYMWAVSEILDSAKEAIFILVGVPLLAMAFFSLRCIAGLVAHTGSIPSVCQIPVRQRTVLISAPQPTPGSE